MRDSSAAISELEEKECKSGTGPRSSELAPGVSAGEARLLLGWKNKVCLL